MQIIISIKKDVRRSPNLVQNEHEHLICAFDSRLRSASAPTRRSNHLSGANNDNLTEIKKLFDKKISQWQKAKSLSLSDFMLFISLELRLRASKKNGEHYSYYVELYDKGDKYVLRISDHHFDATTDKYHKAKKTTAVTFSEEKTEDWDYFKPDNSTTATEYVYYESKIGKDELISIARDIVTYLETGNYPSTIPPDEIHHSPLLDGVFDERETMRFALNQLVKELGEKEGKETFEWYCKTYNVGIADPMPENVKYEIFGTDKQFVEIDDLMAKLSVLRKFFRNRDKDKRYNYKVRICSAENDGKDPIHAYKYPTGTAYADIRFEIHSEGSSGWDYLRIAYKFDNTNEVRIDCDALPEYKELIAQLQQSDNNSTYAFAKEIAALYEQGERLDWVKAKKLAAPHRIESEQAIMQACELAVVLSARKIAQNGQSIAQRYAALKDLYEQQVTIRPLDTQSKLLQQYSTPCPLAFLLGEYVKGATDLKEHQQYYLEPSAGNGMLTIALPTDKVFANDLDEIRYQNLLTQGFHKVGNGDALRMIANPNFRGIITNPPFAKLAPKDKIERHGWEINTLDYKMAVLALDNMANHGRAAIIVGGKMWNSYWKQQSETSKKRVLFGQWKTFLGYLYATYNVEDVIYINGDNIYRKQGTTYPIVVILINRRWNEYSEEHKPNYVFDPERDTIIDTFDQLFERMMKHLQSAPSSLDDINVEEIRRKLEDGTAAEEEKRERDIAARKRKFAFKLKLQLQLKEETEPQPQVQVGAWYVNNKHHDMVTYIYDNWGGKYQRRIYMNGQYKSSNEFTDSEIFLQNHTKIAPPQWAVSQSISGVDTFAKYQKFIQNALSSNNRDRIECTELISEHSQKIVNYLLNKNISKYYIKATDVRHAKNKHSKQVEYKYGQIPITNADLMKIPEILAEPTNIDLPLSNTKNGQGIRFIKEYPDGKIYCVMVDEYETEELSVKTSYKKSPLHGNDAILDPKLNVRNARAVPMLSANIVNFFRIK